MLQLAESGPDECDTARQLAATRMDDLERKIGDLRWTHTSLGKFLAICDRPRADRRYPLLRTLHTDRQESR